MRWKRFWPANAPRSSARRRLPSTRRTAPSPLSTAASTIPSIYSPKTWTRPMSGWRAWCPSWQRPPMVRVSSIPRSLFFVSMKNVHVTFFFWFYGFFLLIYRLWLSGGWTGRLAGWVFRGTRAYPPPGASRHGVLVRERGRRVDLPSQCDLPASADQTANKGRYKRR